MFNLDPAKLLVISVIGLVVIGPERLPRLARQFGSALHVLTTYREQAEAEIRKAVPDLGLPTIPRNPASVVGTFLTSLPLVLSWHHLSTGTPRLPACHLMSRCRSLPTRND